MKLTCERKVVSSPPTAGARAFYKNGVIDHYEVDCPNLAVIVILFHLEENGWNDATIGGSGYCAEHAPEGAHEARSSMSDDEFVIVNLPDPLCGHFDPLLGPCVCGDPANHKPGGKYHKGVAS
jgi:hypothetical protein